MKKCITALVLVGLVGTAASEPTMAQDRRPVFRSVATALRFSPNGKRLMSAGSLSPKSNLESLKGLNYKRSLGDKRLRVWDTRTTRQIWLLPASPIGTNHPGRVLLLPDFKTMLTTWGAWEVKPVDIHSFRFKPYIKIWSGGIGSLALSPDEKILAIGVTRGVEFRDAKTTKSCARSGMEGRERKCVSGQIVRQ